MEEMLTPQQAADYLNVSIYVIRRHLYSTGKLKPDARTRTGELRFSKQTLNALKPIIGKRGRVKVTVEMDDQRLKEIVELANTVLPITGSIPDAERLKRETKRALLDLYILPKTRQVRYLINKLRFIQQEAEQSGYSVMENLSTDPNSDRGDHDLK